MSTNNNKNNNNNNNKKNNNKKKKKIPIMNRRPRRTNRQIRRFRMPVAQTASVPKLFIQRRITGTSATVSGCDLVYAIPDNLVNATGSNVITIIPANPAYWIGTRVSQIAAGYQNYRPIQFDVIYIPQCAVTQQGNVIGGTLWNTIPTENNLQQTLKTSNGGMLTQCYRQATSIVRMKTNLQYNLYRTGGAIDQESNPFIFIALAIACQNNNGNAIVPGYFYVRYTYIFKNPIGSGITYQNTQLTTRQSKRTYLLNASLYLCKKITTINGVEIPIGARLDVEYDNNNNNPVYHYYYNGTPVDSETITNIWVLENQPTVPSNLSSLRVYKEPNNIEYTATMNTPEPNYIFNLNAGQGISYKDGDNIRTIINNTMDTIFPLIKDVGTKVYQILDLSQNFGTVDNVGIEDGFQFISNALWTILKPSTRQLKKEEEPQREEEKEKKSE
jgi:hypothetical protein